MKGHRGQPSGEDTEQPDLPDFGERFFERMVAEASDAVITADAEGTIVYANEAVEDLLGYAPADLLGAGFTGFVPERFRSRYESWHRRYSEGDDGTPLSNETFEVTWQTADGEEQRLSVSAFGYESDGRRLITGFLRKAPEQDATGELLREEKVLIDEIFDTSPVALSVRDADGELLRANDRAAELVGIDPDDISEPVEDEVKVKEWSLYDADGEPREHPVEQTLRTGEPLYNEEIVVERPDGDRAYLSASVTPIYEDGEISRVVTAAEDVTELKETQFELERRRAELETELSEVFARIDDAFFALNDDWEFTYVNDEAEDLLRRTEGELIGKSVWEEFPEAVDSTFEREYRTAMETQDQTSFVEYYPPLSTWFEVHAYPSETGLSVYFQDVTDRIEREQELERYETIVETVEDGIYVVGDDGRLSMVNSAFAEMTGYETSEILGARPQELGLYGEEVVERLERKQQRILDGEQASATIELSMRRTDGGELPVESTFVLLPTDGGYERVGVLRDVTDRKRFEQTLTALHESSRELLQLETADAVCESVLETTTEVLGIPGVGIYLYDDEAEELGPAAVSEYVADIFGDLPTFGPGDESITWHAFAEGETVTFDDVLETDLAYRDDTPLRSGIWIPLGDHGVLAVVSEEVDAFDPNDRELADLLAATTEAALDRVERERERRQHERKLEEQNERLDAFASMLAHELRNPLEIAQIYLGMGVDQVVDDDTSTFEEVERALDRIEEMIDTLLVVTRRGGAVDATEVVDLGDVATEWWETVDPDGTLVVETDRLIKADSSRLRQLLENLYRNAEENAGPGVTVRVGDLEDVSASEASGGSTDSSVGGFYVEDDGPGIQEDVRGQVFDPGYSTSNVGIGFGLAVVRQLVEAHDWDCEITESEDGGARFEFTGVDTLDE